MYVTCLKAGGHIRKGQRPEGGQKYRERWAFLDEPEKLDPGNWWRSCEDNWLRENDREGNKLWPFTKKLWSDLNEPTSKDTLAPKNDVNSPGRALGVWRFSSVLGRMALAFALGLLHRFFNLVFLLVVSEVAASSFEYSSSFLLRFR
jgi:hypothetical protein